MGTDVREIILQPGSFNPLHEGHLAIYKASIKHYWAPHRFILASKTCDKGIIIADELNRRSEAIKAQGGHYRIVDSGLFIDIIDIYKKEGYEKVILVVGEDTLYRFFRDWQDYYKDSEEGILMYKSIFRGVEWYVAKRSCPELDVYKDLTRTYLDYYDNMVWSDLPLNDISSTKIRSGELKSGL